MITKVTIKNFRGCQDISTPVGAINRVSGANGTGKTSFGKAILWCLTGYEPRNVLAGPSVCAHESEPTEVELEFEDGRRLQRRRNKTSSSLMMDMIPATDATMLSWLKMSPLAFCTMFFPESYFMLTPQKQRELFLSITPQQDVQAIALQLASADIVQRVNWNASLDKQREHYANQRIACEKQLAMLEGQLHGLSQNNTKKYEEGDKEKTCSLIAELEKQLADKENELKACQARDFKLAKIEEERRTCRVQITKLEQKTCPTCGAQFDSIAREEEIIKINEQIKKCDDLINVGKDGLHEKLKKQYNDIYNYLLTNKNDLNSINQSVDFIKNYNANMEKIKAGQEKYTTEKAHAQQIENLLHPKTGVPGKMLEAKIKMISLAGFRFEFIEKLANGTEKECFSVVREGDGVSVETMSSGERIKFCLALSCMISGLTATPLKTLFIEHTDLLDRVLALRGFQLFAERVTKEAFQVEIIK